MLIIILSFKLRKVLSHQKSLHPEHQNDYCFNYLFVFVLFPLNHGF